MGSDQNATQECAQTMAAMPEYLRLDSVDDIYGMGLPSIGDVSQNSQQLTQGPSQRGKARAFVVTVNNPDPDYIKRVEKESKKFTYCIIGTEVAPTTGTPHLQCYIRFRNGTAFSTVSKIFPQAHVTRALGNAQQNFIYCSKDGNFKEIGERPNFDGHLKGAIDIIEDMRLSYRTDSRLSDHPIIELYSLLSDFMSEIEDELCLSYPDAFESDSSIHSMCSCNDQII